MSALGRLDVLEGDVPLNMSEQGERSLFGVCCERKWADYGGWTSIGDSIDNTLRSRPSGRDYTHFPSSVCLSPPYLYDIRLFMLLTPFGFLAHVVLNKPCRPSKINIVSQRLIIINILYILLTYNFSTCHHERSHQISAKR